ncbi:7141_t:CDS:2 [Entrophospora sp. SA101]|nr:9419_t:CDS:2 [Entrophospora sp. SA101]CAJ0827835.1 7141_t:CDS:2 [Entrophospora sp. SA101]
MSYSRYDAAREQESLLKIVQKTSEALISTIKLNSKTFPKIQEKGLTISKLKKRQTLSHLIHQQQQQLQDHKENSPKEQVNDESTKSWQNSESSSSSGLILSEGKITNEDEELLSKAMDEINQALKQIKVEYVGDLVVPLTWANSAPINSNSTQG